MAAAGHINDQHINDQHINMTESEVLARVAAQALEEKKGIDVQVLDLRGLHSAPASFFVIASGNVPSHVSALCDNVNVVVKRTTGMNPPKIEGYENSEWILMDYFDVVVHIFVAPKRDFYRLEELWADAGKLKIEN